MSKSKGSGGNWKRYIVTLILALVLIGMIAGTYRNRRMLTPLDYADSLDKVAVTVNGNELTLRELAFYVAYEEAQVQQQALVYNPEDPGDYWDSKLNGIFVYAAASNAAMQMAIHDEIFYQMAVEQELTLSEEEEEALASHIEDFWLDLQEDGKEEKLGVTREDIQHTMERMIYGQKMQSLYAELSNLDYEDYDISGEEYQKLLEEQEYEIRKRVWKRVHLGSVTLEN